ncbi:hypothetical protein [Microbacterium sp.]|uniref:hypothetical protein n=1 Tax=Microbacterium sp. TaxID=51671 RepID=UPI0037CBBB3D
MASFTIAALLVSGGIASAAQAQAPAATAGSDGFAATTAVDSVSKPLALAGFNASNLINDSLFYDGNSMSTAQIQQFLDQKIGSCANGQCINILSTSVSSRSAVVSQRTGNLVCNALEGGTMRVAELIYRAQVACGISAKVILVTLQKEQGLVTSRAPSDRNLRAAMGQACPDTAPCDPAFAGIGPQIVSGTTQLKTYRAGAFSRQPGVHLIGYHPNAGCGGTYLNVSNYATAALYNYTPYQPNAAALAAGYGLGDGCSSYGNRNFYNYYTDWFGSTQGETLQVLQVSGTGQRYLVSGGSRWRLATAEMAAQYTWISSVRETSQAEIDRYQDKGAADRAVRTESGIVWLLDSGQRLRLNDVQQVTDFGWDYGALPVASDAQANRYRDGGWLARVVRSGSHTWLVQSGARRQVIDLGMLPRYGIPAVSSEISGAMLAEYPVAAPVLSVGIYRDATNPYRVLTDAGAYTVPDAASGTTLARSAREITAESFAFLTASIYMPTRISSGGRSYVLLEDSWLEVSAAEYPSVLTFSSLPNGAAAGIPSAGRATGPHFIRERSDSQVYLVSSGTMQAASSADQAWITRTYGVNPRVWVALDGAIGDATTPEGLVRTSAGTAYLLDGTRAYQMRDCTQVASWGGNCASLPTVSDTKLASYAKAGLLRDLVRTPAGTTWLPQGGQLRQVLDPQILAVYGITSSTSAISTASAAKLPVGEPALAAGMYSDGSSGRIAVTQGGEFTTTSEQSVGVVRTSARALTPESYAKITVDGALPSRMRSDGRSFILTQEGWLEVSAAAYGGDAAFVAMPTRAWTGIPVAANEQRPHFVRDDAVPQEYLVSGGAVQLVSSAAERASITAAYGVPTKVWALVGGALAGIKVNYDLMAKTASGEVYLIDGSTRYRMSGCSAATDFGQNCASLRVLTSAQLSVLQDGGTLAALLRSPDGYVYLPQSGTKREVPDPRVLSVYGVGTASTPVSAQVLNQLRLGAPVAGVGAYDDRAGDVRVITGDGRTFAIPAASRIGSVTSRAWTISPASIDLMAVEGDLPTRVSAGSQSYILTTDGWLAVSSAAYAPLTFASIGARASEGIPTAGSESRPHFVREQSASQVHLVSSGLMATADEAERAWISSTYGVPSKVWVVPDGTLR